ncbi:MAG: cell division ATP-binding protein FtsE [Armatimonadetes bacterium]|nr:cell division ATP-binding protein FtsE [Armatimonadota bacterium]
MIVFRNVTVRYDGKVEALSRVNLTIPDGEFVFLVGSTGSGKSTLMKLLYRELLPTEGSVYVGDDDVTQLEAKHIPLLRRRLGVVFQDFRLLPYKNAVENVSYALQVIGAEPRDIHQRALSALGRVGLAHRATSMPGQLSGGEQQRVSIARALVNDPTVLLADEPTGNLDPETSLDVIHLLESINESGTTVIVATHDREIVNLLAKRVVELDSGRVARDAVGGYDRQGDDHFDAPREEEISEPAADEQGAGDATED